MGVVIPSQSWYERHGYCCGIPAAERPEPMISRFAFHGVLTAAKHRCCRQVVLELAMSVDSDEDLPQALLDKKH
jgi:hypothetical protein